METDEQQFGNVVFRAAFAPKYSVLILTISLFLWLLVLDGLFSHNLIDVQSAQQGFLKYIFWFFLLVFSAALVKSLKNFFHPHIFFAASDKGIIVFNPYNTSTAKRAAILLPWDAIAEMNVVQKRVGRGIKSFIAVDLHATADFPTREYSVLDDGINVLYLEAYTTKPAGLALLNEVEMLRKTFSQ